MRNTVQPIRVSIEATSIPILAGAAAHRMKRERSVLPSMLPMAFSTSSSVIVIFSPARSVAVKESSSMSFSTRARHSSLWLVAVLFLSRSAAQPGHPGVTPYFMMSARLM